MRRLRICHLIPTLDRGGAEKQLCLLAAGLPRDRFDVHVVVLTRPGPRIDELREADVPVSVVGKPAKLDPRALWRTRRVLRRLKPDLVHTWLFAANSYGRVAARSLGVPRVVAGERCVDLWKTGRHVAIDRTLARFTDRIVTNSSAVRDFYASKGIDRRLFEIIPNGIPPRRGEEIDRATALGRLGLPPERRYVVAVGRLWPQKRYRDLIWAAELLHVVRPDATLVIIGDGPQFDELVRYRNAVTPRESVVLVGQREDAAQLLPHFDAFWLASGYEGQSNALMEAMQAGLPAVVSDIPGNRDLVVPEESGVLVPVGDASAFARRTHALLDDPAERKRLGAAAARRIAEHFTVDAMVARHVRLYEQLLR